MDWNTLAEIDRRHIWHPYATIPNRLPVYPVARAQGCTLELADGRRLIDGMSSWWAALHGYNHPRLNRAAAAQLENMSHVMFGGLTHEPAVRLTQALLDILPAPLNRVFYTDSGSVAVEVAMKMLRRRARRLSWRHLARDVGVRPGNRHPQPVCRRIAAAVFPAAAGQPLSRRMAA